VIVGSGHFFRFFVDSFTDFDVFFGFIAGGDCASFSDAANGRRSEYFGSGFSYVAYVLC
jgi:hypothetical protein